MRPAVKKVSCVCVDCCETFEHQRMGWSGPLPKRCPGCRKHTPEKQVKRKHVAKECSGHGSVDQHARSAADEMHYAASPRTSILDAERWLEMAARVEPEAPVRIPRLPGW